MVATTVLLDCRLASGAFFRIGGNPVGRLRVILAFLQPQLDKRAGGGLVVVEGTSETEFVSTGTLDCWHYALKITGFNGTVDGVLAVGGGAPSQIIFVVDISSSKERAVSNQTIWSAGLLLGTGVKHEQTYLSLRSSVTSRSKVLESTIRWQLSPGHSIRAASPSSLILPAR